MFNWKAIVFSILFFLPTGHSSTSSESTGFIFFAPDFSLENHGAAEAIAAPANHSDLFATIDFSLGHHQKSEEKKNKPLGLVSLESDLSGFQNIKKRYLKLKPIRQTILLITPSIIHSFSLAYGHPFRINDIVTLMHAYRC